MNELTFRGQNLIKITVKKKECAFMVELLKIIEVLLHIATVLQQWCEAS